MEVLCWAPPSIKLENLTLNHQKKKNYKKRKIIQIFQKMRKKITSHDGIKFQLV